MSDELVLTVQPEGDLPAPKSATSHVSQTTDVPPRPREELTDAGVPHPAHRAQ